MLLRLKQWCGWCFLLTLSTACQKGTDRPAGGLAVIDVSTTETEYVEENLIARAAVNKRHVEDEELMGQRQVLELDDDLLLVAELKPIKSENANSPTNPRDAKANIVRTPIPAGIRYKLVVYNSLGIYITDRNYVTGSESTAEPLMLDGGSSYTFVAYSVNSASALPDISFSNSANRTLAGSTVSLTADQDFMHFSTAMTVSGGVTNFLSVILKHRLSQITTNITTEKVGLSIAAITANFSPHNNTGTASLLTGIVAPTGGGGSASVSFPTVSGRTITSSPTLINALENSTTSLNITAMQVGEITLAKVVDNLNVTPGVRYTLNIDINSNDEYLDYNGYPSVRIGGDIWMRHNLGADYTVDPNANPQTQLFHGNYYQFGRNAVVASRTATAVSNFNTTNQPANNAWNIGTEENPIRTATDPCPVGFRVPSRTEYLRLIDNTTWANKGTRNNSATNYSFAKVLITLRSNRDVMIIFPAQGYFGTTVNSLPTGASGLRSRGFGAFYWTSTATTMPLPGITHFFNFGDSEAQVVTQLRYWANKAEVYTIRCIGVQ